VVTWESKATRVAKKTTVRKADDKRSKVGLEEANQRLTNELETSKAENERLAAQLDEEKAMCGCLAEQLNASDWQQELVKLRAERAAVVAIEKKIFDENLRVEQEKHKDRVFAMNRRHYTAVDDMRAKYVNEIKELKEKVNLGFILSLASLTIFQQHANAAAMEKKLSDSRLLAEEKLRRASDDAFFRMREQHAKEIRVLNEKVVFLYFRTVYFSLIMEDMAAQHAGEIKILQELLGI
jgi:hypothetical protein